MNKLSKYILAATLMIILSTLLCHAKTFNGTVLDADTKEPIEGAVVVAQWNSESHTPTAVHQDLKHVKECLTDKNGKWSIKGPRGWENEPIPLSSLFIPYTAKPNFIIFKPGYCSWPDGLYVKSCEGKIHADKGKRIGEGGAIELPKLITREDRWRAIPSTGQIFWNKRNLDKVKNFLRLLNEEQRFLGLPSYIP